MKKLILFLLLVISALSFSSENDIFGQWITEKAKNGNQIIVTFYKKNNLYFGKIIALTIPVYQKGEIFVGKPKMDLSNPNKDLKHRPLVGINFVTNFNYNSEKNRFENGYIYNPENGKTYHCSISFKNKNEIFVKGSLDSFGLIGKKQIWKKVR